MNIYEILNNFINSQQKVLFLGSGVFSSVEWARKKGIDAYGCKEDVDHSYVYKEKLINIHFPTDYFDVIVYIENDKNQINICKLKEIFRILKQIDKNGRFILNSGKDFIEKLKPILLKTKFVLESYELLEEIKTIIHIRKPIQNRTKILVPPGIGDIYWVLIKLQSFLEQNNLGIPDIYVASRKDAYYSAHNRGFPFLEMFPFVNASWVNIENNACLQEIGKPIIPLKFWVEVFEQTGRTIISDILGCDYFMAYNGHINNGQTLEETDPHLQCNWFPPMFRSLKQKKYEEYAKKLYGKYMLCHFKFYGTYQSWLKYIPVDAVIDCINKVSESLQLTPIMTGSFYDNEDVLIQKAIENTNCINLIGKTSLNELFGLIKGSEFILGYPSGITMIAPVLGKKTLIYWSDLYPKGTSWNVVPPTTHKSLYFADRIINPVSADYLINSALKTYQNEI